MNMYLDTDFETAYLATQPGDLPENEPKMPPEDLPNTDREKLFEVNKEKYHWLEDNEPLLRQTRREIMFEKNQNWP